jgi:taurine--2-oxoglutarate transaminase
MKDEHIVERAAETGQVLAEMLAELVERHPSVGEVRSIGLFGVIELVRNRQTKEPMTPYNGSSTEMNRLKKYLLDHGVFLYTHWHTVLLIPPLIITPEELKAGFDVLDQALQITDAAVRPG